MKKTQIYYVALLFSAAICWSPFKMLAYLLPFLVAGMLLVFTKNRLLWKRIFVWIFLWAFMTVIYSLINPEIQYANVIIAFVTWAGIVVLLLLPVYGMQNPLLLHKAKKLAWAILFLESLWGIVQGVYGFTQTGSFDIANGDYVEGTIHPSLAPELSYSNVMFAINIALLLLFLLPEVWRQKNLKVIVYGLGVLAFVMASVVHVILFLIISGGMAFLLLISGKQLRSSWMARISLIFGTIPLLVWVFLPRNLGTAPNFGLQFLQGEEPKSVSIITALTDMPREYWFMSVVGLGPGQYASRAGLISTGLYFGGLKNPKRVPYLPNKLTKAQEKYLLPLWQWHESNPFWGSTQKPYFSWLAIYSELGLLGWLVIVVILLLLLKKVKRLPKVYDVEKFVLVTAILFIFFLGFQENNWEVPQAWFSGLLFLKILYANAVPIHTITQRQTVASKN
jgi:hypothetical protein